MKKFHIYILLIIALISFNSCKKFFKEEPQNNPEAIFENLWKTYDEEYAPFEERNVDWQAAYNTYRPMVKANTSNDQLFSILSQMLEIFDDGHISLTAPNKQIYYSNKVRREKIDDELFNKGVIKILFRSRFQNRIRR